jgi:BolA family transcriptional regulator, general stress-responsive regulator
MTPDYDSSLAPGQAARREQRGMAAMTMKQRIKARLTAGLAPIALEVFDESDQHKGHSGAREGGETHYRINIVADGFAGKGKVERHRMVYGLLKEEFAAGVHALALRTLAPGEE